MQPLITVICPFTRHWAVERWVNDFINLSFDKERTNLCFIIDIDDPRILRELRRLEGYRSLEIQFNTDNDPHEAHVASRRLRIAEVMNQFKPLIEKTDGEIIFGLEDDTVFEGMDVKRLYNLIELDDEVGFVEGVQCGRWGVKMIGAWKADDVNDIRQIDTLLPKEGYEEIDGGGYYGYATRRELFLEHEHAWNGEPWGPDVAFVLSIRRKGYRCFVDWETVFKHNDFNVLLDPLTGLDAIRYTKDKTGNWNRSDL